MTNAPLQSNAYQIESSRGEPSAPQDVSREEPPGATAGAPWRLPLAAWWQIVKRAWVMSGFHNISLLAAGTAFFVFLAITPLIGATVMIYGLVGDVGTVQHEMASIINVVPAEAAKLIQDQLINVVTVSSSVKGLALAVSLFFAIYGGMRAATGLIGALNIINEESETRGIVHLTLLAAGLTVAAVFIAAVGLISGGVFAWLQTEASAMIGTWTTVLFKLVTWVAAIALGSFGFALIMRFGPDRRPAKWRWLSPGALLSTLLWLAISFGFSLYVAYISDYSATYGSLSAIVVFLMWLFLSAYGVLLGAVLNAEIERQTVCDTTVGKARPIGERGAVLADQIDDTLPTLSSLERSRSRKAQHARRTAAGEPTAASIPPAD